MSKNGSILPELEWIVLVKIPKGNAYTWWIGLVEVVWKVGEELIDTHI